MRGKMIAKIAVALMLVASVALAEGDVTVKVEDTNNISNVAKGGKAKQKQNQEQGQEQTFVNENRREHIQAPAGPAGNFVSGMPTPVPSDCVVIKDGQIDIKRVRKMADSGSFLEKKGGMWHGLFSKRNKGVPYVDYNTEADINRPFTFYSWEPAKLSVPWDQVGYEAFCEGDYGYPLGMPLGQCLAEVRAEVNLSEVLACYTVRYDIHASGVSTGGGITGSAINGGKNDNLAGSVSVAAITGTTVGYFNKAYDVYVVGLTSPYVVSAPPASAPPPPPAPQACNPQSFLDQLKYYAQEIIWCVFRCLNNETLRFGKGNTYQDVYYCQPVGQRDKTLLVSAVYEYGVGKRDFNLGRELAPGQKPTAKPTGVWTRTLPAAQVVMRKMLWNESLAIRELNGPVAQYDFARMHPDAFVASDGQLHVPTKYEELKR